MSTHLLASSLLSVDDMTVVVTGAASGIGLAISEVMAHNGAHVTMIDADGDRARDVAGRLSHEGHAVKAVALDVTDTKALEVAIGDAARRRGRLDAVFANAGISAGPGFGSQPTGRLEQIDDHVWERVLSVNLTSVMHTLRLASVHMKARGQGKIIVTASIAGLRAEPFCGYAYAAAKGAVVNLVRQAAVELAPHGVLINAIAPGFIHTDFAGGRLNDEAVQERLSQRIPMGRLGTAAELQGLALYLASPACSYTTGTVIPVDGGILAG